LLPSKFTIITPDIIKNNPIKVYILGICWNLIAPTTEVAIIHKPAKDAYVIPTGIDFMTIDKVYMQATIVTPVIILGINIVKPSALLAKLFDAVPRTTANIKII
tara:strand:+ start:967 stop:1278 length:312 start_codon:yes stop_codon:yes gene_type:complete